MRGFGGQYSAVRILRSGLSLLFLRHISCYTVFDEIRSPVVSLMVYFCSKYPFHICYAIR